jgi:hypothetical protein
MSENTINQAPPIQSELETTNNIDSSRVSGNTKYNIQIIKIYLNLS